MILTQKQISYLKQHAHKWYRDNWSRYQKQVTRDKALHITADPARMATLSLVLENFT